VKKILIAALIATSTSLASAATILSETFETVIGAPANLGYVNVASGGTINSVNTWTVGGRGVDLINNNYGAPSGIAIDLNGLGPGSISTWVAAEAGSSLFTLSFDASANPDGGSAPRTILWTIGSKTGSFTALSGGPSNFTGSWTATAGASINVSFAGDFSNTTAFGPTIDNISLTQVSAVPEPGEWAMMLAGLAMVGAISRKRKNKAA
jgi:hypothetical protein